MLLHNELHMLKKKSIYLFLSHGVLGTRNTLSLSFKGGKCRIQMPNHLLNKKIAAFIRHVRAHSIVGWLPIICQMVMRQCNPESWAGEQYDMRSSEVAD